MTLNPTILKLASRKLGVALGAIVPLLVERQYIPAASVAVTYILAQAHVDAKVASRVLHEVSVVAESASKAEAAKAGVVVG